MQPQLWSLHGLSVELKIYPVKLGQLLAALPADGKDKKGDKWLMAKVVAHLLEQAAGGPAKLNRNNEDARHKKAQADKLELDLAVRREELVRADDIGDQVDAVIFGVRQKMLALPRRLAPVLEGKKPTEIEAAVKEEVHAALSALASMTVDQLLTKARQKKKKGGRGADDWEEAEA